MVVPELNGKNGKYTPIWLISHKSIPKCGWKQEVLNSTNTTNSAKNRNQSNKMNDNRVGAKRLVGRESTKRLRSDPRCFYLIYILVLNNLPIQMTIAKKFIPKNTTATILNNAEYE